MPLIQLDCITKHYGVGEHRLPALKPLSLSIETGEWVGVIGASGSGKSTLMHILGFLDQVDSGTYHFKEQLLTEAKPDHLAKLRNQAIGFVFQAFHLLPRLSVLDNVALPLLYQGMHHKAALLRASQALEQTRMSPFGKRLPNQLSGGQQQRVALARALICQPDLLLADEPTGALDSQTSEEILHLFDDLHKLGKTIVLVTHNPVVAKRCTRILQLADGCLIDDRWN